MSSTRHRGPTGQAADRMTRRPMAWTLSVIALAAAILGGALTLAAAVLASAVLLGVAACIVCAAVACLGAAHGNLTGARRDLSEAAQAANGRTLIGLVIARLVSLVAAIGALVVYALPGFPAPALAAGLAGVFVAIHLYLRFRLSALLKAVRVRTSNPDQRSEAAAL